MKKKATSLLLATVVLFTVSACNSTTLTNPPGQSGDQSQTNSTQACVHVWEAASCTKPKTCSLCGETDGNPLGHAIVIYAAQSATCTTSGWTEYEACSRCDYTTYKQIAPLNHNYVESITRAATCVQKGEKTFRCTKCKDSYTEEFELTAYTAEEIYEQAKDVAVEIITYDRNGDALSLGSGFVYNVNGQIVTNYHVIEESCDTDVYIGEVPYEVVSVLAYDINRDIAILKINATNLSTLEVCTQTVKTGSTVYALGSSRGLTSTFSRGIITSANREIDGVTYIQHDAAISSGNSGGPLINEYCEIIGINTLPIKESQNLNFAIFTSEISNLNYGTPMTLAEVYAKECDAFAKVKNYVMQQGNLDSDGDEYIKITNVSYSDDGTEIMRSIFYNPSTDIITIAILWGNDYFLTIELDEYYYTYDYTLLWSSTNYYMMGTLYANTFSSSTTYLSYSYTNIYSSLKSSFSKVGASLAKVLIMGLNIDLKEIGVTALDLDFLNF